MKKRTYPLGPKFVSENAWFYETKRGVDVVQQLVDPKKGYLGTCMIIIPWHKIEDAVRNHRAVKRQRTTKP